MSQKKYRLKKADPGWWKQNINCLDACPAHVNIQGYVALINQGKYREALELFKEAHPFPAVCGRVCHHPCEGVCRRGDVEAPVAMQYLHRFLADVDARADSGYVPEVKERREEKVAIIGAGPAGLGAAYFLAKEGYPVTVFERLPVAGGMMAVGIPECRLPRDVLGAEIKVIEQMGVRIRTGMTFGEDVTLDGLKKEGFKAFFFATGFHRSRTLGIEGEELPGTLKGVDFLREVALGKKVAIGRKVIVIGGGNVAIDVALTAKRVGGEEITLVCLEKRDEMPAWDYEVEEALEEGIEIIHRRGPKRFLEKDGRVRGVEFKACTSVLDEEGRFNPRYDEKDLTTLNGDTVIVAIGQAADISFAEKSGIKVSPKGGLMADPITLETPLPGVFAGGDLFYGPKSVVDAVASGKEACGSIHRFLNGLDMRAGRDKDWTYEKPSIERKTPGPRVTMKRLSLGDRKGNFNEIGLGFSEEESRREAERCLRCDYNITVNSEQCILCAGCVDVCPYGCIQMISLDQIESDEAVTDLSHVKQGAVLIIDEAFCIRCGLCVHRCPTGAIGMERFEILTQVD